MNIYTQNLNRIEFMTTLVCTGRCRHCSQGEHKSSEFIDGTAAADIVYKLAENFKIDSVMTFGGEPLLNPRAVYKIHFAAKEKCIPKRQMITNGYFSKSIEKIQETALKCYENGINDILLSVDAFHQETIDLKYVKIFAAALKSTGARLRTHPAWLVDKNDNNVYNNRTRKILKEFEGLGISPSSGNVIFPSGNALKYLSDYFETGKKYSNPYIEDPENVCSICISPAGNVLGGNIYKTDILKILESYKPA